MAINVLIHYIEKITRFRVFNKSFLQITRYSKKLPGLVKFCNVWLIKYQMRCKCSCHIDELFVGKGKNRIVAKCPKFRKCSVLKGVVKRHRTNRIKKSCEIQYGWQPIYKR